MLRTICSMARGRCNRDEPAFLQACKLTVTDRIQDNYTLLHASRLLGLWHVATTRKHAVTQDVSPQANWLTHTSVNAG